MTDLSVTESHVEQAALEWFSELDWNILHSPDIAPGEPAAERMCCPNVIIQGRRNIT